MAFIGLWPITTSCLLQKRARSKGTSLHRHYPTSTVLLLSPTPARTSPRRALLRVATPHPGVVSHVAQATFPTCCPHYPGRPEQVLWSVTCLSCIGLPRMLGGSASTTVFSGPAQGSLALRPARLQPYWLTFVPGVSAGRSPYPTVRVATGMNRQFPGPDLHPLVICALMAHHRSRVEFCF